MGEVTDASGKLNFQIIIRLSSCLVIVEQAVDVPVPVQYVKGVGNIGYRIKDDVILPVKAGHGRAVPHPQREEGEIIRHALEYQTFFSRFAMLPDVADVLRGYAAFEKSVAHLVASCDIRKADGKIRFTVVYEM